MRDSEVVAAPTLPPGAQLVQVQPGTPAADAGLRQGDVILEVNRRPAHSVG